MIALCNNNIILILQQSADLHGHSSDQRIIDDPRPLNQAALEAGGEERRNVGQHQPGDTTSQLLKDSLPVDQVDIRNRKADLEDTGTAKYPWQKRAKYPWQKRAKSPRARKN